ncbi:MAG: RodZ domain-containing protein [Pseudomonadota bacterium]
MTDQKIGLASEDQKDNALVAYPDLKALREAKGLSLRDIFERTRISVVNLEAIETGQFHLLPAPVYARPFIRSYALVIGAESEILLEAYEKHLQSLNDRIRQEQEAGGTQRKTEGRYKRAILLLSAATAAIIVIFILVRYNQPGPEAIPVQPASPVQQAPDAKPAETSPPIAQPRPPPETSPGQEKTVQADNVPKVTQSLEPLQARAPVIPADGIPAKSVPPEIPKPATEQKYHVFMEARESVWLRIREDGNRSEQMILEAGETLERFAAESFTIDIGNAGGLDIMFQGKAVGNIGKRGQVVHLRFP